MNSFELRQEARRERLLAIADKFEREGNSRYARARQMASAIPFGQPILVGHYSERRDRNYRGRISSNFEKAFAAQESAKAAREKAASVGSGGISSDDPDAVAKLRSELAQIEQLQAFMIGANKIVRAFYKAGVRDAGSGALWPNYLGKLRELRPTLSEERAVELLKPDFCGRIGFADYQTKNNNANMRRIKGRIAQLERRAVIVEKAEADGDAERVIECANCKVVINLPLNRVQVKFPGKPEVTIRTRLKANGFRWSPTEQAWQKMLNRYYIEQPAEYLRAEFEKVFA